MISYIFLSFIALLVALLPVYLWWYGISRLLGAPWNRRRFVLGMLIGGCSVGIVWLFSYITTVEHIYILLMSVAFILTVSAFIFFLIYRGSVYARGILKKVAIVNIGIIFTILMVVSGVSVYIPGAIIVSLSMLPLLLSSLIEESSKHLMSIGLMSQDFRFSRSDIIIFTLFVVLGFVFIENLLYWVVWDTTITTWIFRSFFSLSAHLLSAVICAYAWWRALSYPPFSVKYIIIFSLGFIAAVMVHLGYNLILAEGSMLGLFAYMATWYYCVTRGLITEQTHM